VLFSVHNDVKTFWPRVVYFSVGAIFTPILLGLSFILLRAPVEGASRTVLYLVSAFFGFMGVVTASAFRAAFRNPPWWIISPEQTEQLQKLEMAEKSANYVTTLDAAMTISSHIESH
jgi:hypothetical protein